MICAMMAELHLQGLGTGSQRHDLMPETDAESRNAALDQFGDGGYSIVARLRVSRTVGQKDAVRIQGQCLRGTGLRRQNSDFATALRQHAQDIAFDAVIESDNMILRRNLPVIALAQPPFGLEPAIRLGGGNHLG